MAARAQRPVSHAELARLATAEGFTLPADLLPPLAEYLDQLMRWNAVMNLVGARSWQEAFSNLVVDSLHLAPFLDALPLPATPRCWDLGSGAGLPGIPLRMLWQRGTYTLIEAREKRALFLMTVLARHPLPGVHVHQGRVEAFMAGPPRQEADLVLSRAFMPWEQLLDFTAPFLASHAVVTLLLNEACESLPPGWQLIDHHSYTAGKARRYFAAVTRSS